MKVISPLRLAFIFGELSLSPFQAEGSVVEAAFITLHYLSPLPYLEYMATCVYIITCAPPT